MIGLDTNIVLRVFDRTDADQSAAVDALLSSRKSEGSFLLNPIVLSEFAWTLQRTYKKPRDVIADHLDRVLQSPEFIVPFLDEAMDAARRYRDGPADFVDYFLAAINRSLSCETTLTFDKDAAKDGDLYSLLKV
ncbi:PIN domain-containing protein [Tardiphaga sp.]|uniref:PIN domain-containing protein n=1 Tax=Tardiphaga sp. TaxID=1926292 RepID=UPI0037D99CEB